MRVFAADPYSQEKRGKYLNMSGKLVDKFKVFYDSANCLGVQLKTMGRSYDMGNQEDAKQFALDGGNENKCPLICANAARWVIEILNDEKLI